MIDSVAPSTTVAAVHAGTALEASALGLRPPLFDVRTRPFNQWARAARAELAFALRLNRLDARLRKLR